MLMVAPSGATKLVTLFETPARFSSESIVRGSVAEEELVEKAVKRAGDIERTCRTALWRPKR